MKRGSNSEGTGVQRQRSNQILNRRGSFAYTSAVPDGILEAAVHLLSLARQQNYWNEPNHLTRYGPPSIILATTAFEAFINEALLTCLRSAGGDRELYQELARKGGGPIEKFQRIPPSMIPAWLQPLESLDVLVSRKLLEGDKDIGWDAKLTSYRLAEWCARVVADAVDEFAAAVCPRGNESHHPLSWRMKGGAGNFRSLRIDTEVGSS